MFPVLIPENSPNQPRPLGLKLLIIGLATIFATATAMLFAADAADSELLTIIMAFALAMIGSGVVSLLLTRSAPQKEKDKRGLDGLDLYSVIDRMVSDLDDDEAAYLRRRLDERGAQQKDDLTLTVDEMLQQRARDRDSRQDRGERG
jgi:hypothetical protein